MAAKKVLEKDFKEVVKKDLDSLGPRCWYEKIQQVSIKGTPDILACIDGKFVALELKRSANEKSKSRALQEYKLDLISKAGGIGLFVNPENWTEVFNKLKEIE